MRHFHSYGPLKNQLHYCVDRKDLVEQGMKQLIGDPVEGGHYFTIWASRQRGKTWLMQQIKREIPQQYGDKFAVFSFSFGNLRGMTDADVQKTAITKLPEAFSLFLEDELPGKPQLKTWGDFRRLFAREEGLWDRPLILLIDEVDTAPPALLDLIVGRFRELYIQHERNWLHGLALVGVRAVLGVDSQRGSPFNIQKSLHVPNLTRAEVEDMYQQYQTESGQIIDPAVVRAVYEGTLGQPGLVSWFGELLTEKYNPGPEQTIGQKTWRVVWHKSRFIEPNNTVMNLIAKARDSQYQGFISQLFSQANLPFSFHTPLQGYLYMHGIITSQMVEQPNGDLGEICRFSSPFIQDCLYNALSTTLVGDRMPILTLDPLDDLEDVFETTQADGLDVTALLQRYKDFLGRLKAKGLNPWLDQPRRKSDLHLTEAVGHFHLYSWLKDAIGRRCAVSPEFPTGNGKIDLHLRCDDKRGIIEVKSFQDKYQLQKDHTQAALYAKNLGLKSVTLAVFVPVEDETVLAKLSEQVTIEGVLVTVVAIGWT